MRGSCNTFARGGRVKNYKNKFLKLVCCMRLRRQSSTINNRRRSTIVDDRRRRLRSPEFQNQNRRHSYSCDESWILKFEVFQSPGLEQGPLEKGAACGRAGPRRAAITTAARFSLFNSHATNLTAGEQSPSLLQQKYSFGFHPDPDPAPVPMSP